MIIRVFLVFVAVYLIATAAAAVWIVASVPGVAGILGPIFLAACFEAVSRSVVHNRAWELWNEP